MFKLPKVPLFRKNLEKKKKEAFEKRAKAFYEEYKKLIIKYGCDWNATLRVTPDGILPNIAVMDCKDKVDAEEKIRIKKKDDQDKN